MAGIGHPAPPRGPREVSRGRAFLRYNLARLGVLLVIGALAYLAGLRGILLVLSALLVSGILSYFLLARLRIDFAAAVARSVQGGLTPFGQRTEQEDTAAERWHEERTATLVSRGSAPAPRDFDSPPPPAS